MDFVPHNAPLVVLGFLFTGLCLGLVAIGFLIGLVAKKPVVVRVTAVGGLVIAGIYGAAWAGGGLSSHERTLAPGELKYFCEIDCHLAYSITGVRTMRTIGSGPSAANATGTFYLVTVRTWFDPRTISSRRPLDVPLWPNPRQATVVDSRGRAYRISTAGQRALKEPSVPLTRELRPGESYETRLVFDLPTDVQRPRLFLADAFPLSLFLIGHENGPLHRKVFFQLPESHAPALGSSAPSSKRHG